MPTANMNEPDLSLFSSLSLELTSADGNESLSQRHLNSGDNAFDSRLPSPLVHLKTHPIRTSHESGPVRTQANGNLVYPGSKIVRCDSEDTDEEIAQIMKPKLELSRPQGERQHERINDMEQSKSDHEWQRWKGGWKKQTTTESVADVAESSFYTPRTTNKKVLKTNQDLITTAAESPQGFQRDTLLHCPYKTKTDDTFSQSDQDSTHHLELSSESFFPTQFSNNSFHEANLEVQECRRLDINDIKDIVMASSGIRFHSPNNLESPVVDESPFHDELSSHIEQSAPSLHVATFSGSADESMKSKQSHSSPTSVMAYRSFLASHSTSRRLESLQRKLNSSSISENGSSRCSDAVDDDSFYTYRVRDKIRVVKISDDSEVKEDDESIVDKVVFSSHFSRLHEFITGNSMCCTSRGKKLIHTACLPNDDYADDDDDDIERYLQRTFDEDDDDLEEFGEEISLEQEDDVISDYADEESIYSRRLRQGSLLHDLNGPHTVDDESKSDASSKSSRLRQKNIKVTRKNKPVSVKELVRGASRGRSPTAKHGYNSDRSLSTGGSGGSFKSVAKYGRDEELKAFNDNPDADSLFGGALSEASVVESVLTHDQATWMEMTKPSPQRSTHDDVAESDILLDATTKEIFLPYDKAPWMEMTKPLLPKSNQNVTSKSVTVLTDESMETSRVASPLHPYVNSVVPHENRAVDGYFKKLLSVGIQLKLNEPITKDCKSTKKSEGKLFLRFRGFDGVNFIDPFFIWKGASDEIRTFELFDIQAIRTVSKFELNCYPYAVPDHSFMLSMNDGTTVLFEAINYVQTTRVLIGLQGIKLNLERDITSGDSRWIIGVLESVGGNLKEIITAVPIVMMNKTDQLVKKTLLEEARVRRRKRRELR